MAMALPPKYVVGSHVLLSQEREGEVKFIGTVEFGSGEWYGIELTDGSSVGQHSGSVDGKEYFKCDASRGIFCKIDEIRRLMRDKDFDNPRRRRNLSMKSLSDIMKNDNKATVEQLLVIPDDREDDVIISEGGRQFKHEFEEQMKGFSYEELIALCPFNLIGRGVAGVDEMRSFMDDSKVFFGMLQVEVGTGQFLRHKNIFIHFNGEKHRKPLQRAKANKKLHIAKEVIGHCHAPLVVTSAEQFSVDWVFQELRGIFVADNIKSSSGSGKKQDINSLKQDYQKRMAEAQKRAARERIRLEQEAKRMEEDAKNKRLQDEKDRLRRIAEEEERKLREKEEALRRQKEAELEAKRKKKEEAEAAKRAEEAKKQAAAGGSTSSAMSKAGDGANGAAGAGTGAGAAAGGKKKRRRRKKKKKDDWSDDRPWTGQRVLACIHEDKSPLNWAVFKASKTEVIPLVWGHGSIGNLREELAEDQVMYGIMRLSFGEDRWRRSHWIFFLWTPDSMTELADPKVRTKKNKQRMLHVSWQTQMKALLKPWGICVTAESLEKVNVEDWIMRVQKTVVVDNGQELTAEMLQKTLDADQMFFASLKERRELERKKRMEEEAKQLEAESQRQAMLRRDASSARMAAQGVYDTKLKQASSGTDLLSDEAFAKTVADGKMPCEETKEEESEIETEEEEEPEPIEIKLSPEELAELEAERKKREEIEHKRSEKQRKIEKNAISSKLVLESVELCKRTHEDLVWVLFEPRL